MLFRSDRLNIPPESEEQARAEQLTAETNVYELVQTLREELPRKAEPK